MSHDEIQSLAENILEQGLQENLLVTHDGSVLVDGRNRLRACGVAGVAPRYSYLPEGTTEAEILRLMVSANVKSRDLTPGQLAMIGHYYMLELEAVPVSDLVNYPPLREYDHQTPRSYAAAVVGVSSKTIWQAKVILDFNPNLAQQVKAGTVRLNTAYERVMADRGLRKEEDLPRGGIPRELPKQPPRGKDNTRKAVEARRGWLKYLAEQELSAMEISNRLDISEGHVRVLARRYNIPLPGDAWSYKRRKPTFDVNRIAQVVADDLIAMQDSVTRIREHVDELDPDKVDEWGRIVYSAYRQFRNLARDLGYGLPKKRTNDDNGTTA